MMKMEMVIVVVMMMMTTTTMMMMVVVVVVAMMMMTTTTTMMMMMMMMMTMKMIRICPVLPFVVRQSVVTGRTAQTAVRRAVRDVETCVTR